MKIIDTNGREREVLSAERMSHSHEDIYGKIITEEYVKVLVKGKNRQWINWYPLKEFAKYNPTVKV